MDIDDKTANAYLNEIARSLSAGNVTLTYHPESHKYEFCSSTFYGYIDADMFQKAMEEAVNGK